MLKKLLNEVFEENNWKKQFQQMKVYDNPFHTAFAEDNEHPYYNEDNSFDNLKENKMLTKKIIERLQKKQSKLKNEQKKEKLGRIIEKLEKNYERGNYLKEVKTLYTLFKENFFNRDDMPQVHKDDLDEAIRFLQNSGITVKRGSGTPDTFESTQKEISDEKVSKIMDDTESPNDVRTMKPIIVSNDNYIVDGHHRCKAILIKFGTEKMPYLKIDLPMKRAIQMYKYAEENI